MFLMNVASNNSNNNTAHPSDKRLNYVSSGLSGSPAIVTKAGLLEKSEETRANCSKDRSI